MRVPNLFNLTHFVAIFSAQTGKDNYIGILSNLKQGRWLPGTVDPPGISPSSFIVIRVVSPLFLPESQMHESLNEI